MKFKRIAVLAAAALLALSCVSCSTENIDCPADESSGKESNQIPNPMTEVASADEINSRIGCFMKSLDGAEEEKYTVFSGETENTGFPWTAQNTFFARQRQPRIFPASILRRGFSAILLSRIP